MDFWRYSELLQAKIGTKSCSITAAIPITGAPAQVVATVMFFLLMVDGVSIFYYVIFVLLQQYIMLNLFILVLMQNFEENYINTDNPIQNFSNNAEDFKTEWMNFCNKNQILYIN